MGNIFHIKGSLMRLFFIFIILVSAALADMGKIVNLELFDNQNPAIITDIQDELDHVVVDISASYDEEENNTLNTKQEQAYNIGMKTYKRFDGWVAYLRLFQTVQGVASDPTHTTEDISQTFSQVELGLATTLFDSIDVGLSFGYELEDENTTTRTHQLGFRYIGDAINMAVVAGSKEKQSEILVSDFQNFISVGFSTGETSDTLFDLSATLRPKSSTAAEGSLLEHVQAKSYEGTIQIQGDENFNRSGMRLDYKKTFARSTAELDSFSQKIRFHTGMKVEREENSYSVSYISYEKQRQGTIINHSFEVGVSLRGFYF